MHRAQEVSRDGTEARGGTTHTWTNPLVLHESK